MSVWSKVALQNRFSIQISRQYLTHVVKKGTECFTGFDDFIQEIRATDFLIGEAAEHIELLVSDQVNGWVLLVKTFGSRLKLFPLQGSEIFFESSLVDDFPQRFIIGCNMISDVFQIIGTRAEKTASD